MCDLRFVLEIALPLLVLQSVNNCYVFIPCTEVRKQTGVFFMNDQLLRTCFNLMI